MLHNAATRESEVMHPRKKAAMQESASHTEHFAATTAATESISFTILGARNSERRKVM
jgi:hypothetical protein